MPATGTQSDTALVADGLLTVDGAAAFCHVARSTIYKAMDAGLLAYVKIGRARRIPRKALIEFAARGLRGGWARDEAAQR